MSGDRQENPKEAVPVGPLDPVGQVPEGAEELPREERFHCELQPGPDTVHVLVHGELDLETIEEAQQRLAEVTSTKRDVTLDLRGLHFIDSTGLNLIIQTAALARIEGFGFNVIPSAEPGVQRLFEIAGADRYLPLVEPGAQD